ncbi:MAG: nucleotide sugar dehydrogenase [Candidatus Thermoplasmatota archaeon]|nr:nucleotide sugar dehydrogenase [Euryarchaeota archaeon]MBU4032091.1 nucleotide sugar dehydrogenase [Candidatus Thermoplasmatota archaeon]MBU4071618.1 nucleotide sugar dehydrogenase [Candidatus Thermoplasmatota archaeon]MBU4145146.1 nucleotide sugar dehydrogenase [Candidatus Thermoplasmatota archaeon]MBU4592573.1 nucleotide sugar dehydrogenase [Candidatus Thermoplasmatota archaeon]
MKIVVIGMGYVGIPAAALFADVDGFQVTGVQRRSERSGWKIDWLNQGKNPIGGDEPGLEELLQRVHKKGTFKVVDDYSVVKDADAVLIDVQTPTDEDHIPRYESLKEVSLTISKLIKKGALVVIESTVAPGTTEHMVRPILEKGSGMKAGEDFYLAFSYERVMVGRLLKNITDLPRIVGGINKQSTDIAMKLYANIVKAPLHPTDSLTAEVSKVVENTYRDVNIAFANEVAIACESLGVDVYRVRELVNTLPNDPSNPSTNPVRNMHFPGAGVGGHCLPKDPWLFKYGLDTYGTFKFEPKIIIDSRNLNDYMPIHTVDMLEETLKNAEKKLEGAKIVILGVAFLENSDDTRNSPSKTFFDELKKRGAEPVMHDHLVREFERPFVKELEGLFVDADAIILAVKHDIYKDLDFAAIKDSMRTPILIDGRNFYRKENIESAGFVYRGIGKPK